MNIPPIFVRVPVRSPLDLKGTANVFEAQFCLDVTVDNKVTQHHEVHASSGSGTRGTWSLTLDLPVGKCILYLYEPSAKDGSPQNEIWIPVLVESG
jgi:hypothetical protein